MKEVSSSTIQELIELATQIVGRHDNVVLSHTSLSALPESDHQTLTIYVECLPEKCFDLNLELSAALVEAELDEVGCVVHFEVYCHDSALPFSEEEMRSAFKTVAESRAKRNFSKFNTPLGKKGFKSI
ncbi:hypothetical protein [Vibrio cholerae]|uniref:hypothetical protein n=1 Tax=Vibrio cholerae TaxID=666 RepID=UPI000E64A3CB|nr:hypothetical protein [Vibrio cholerae]MVC37302.1 hypothetical protein [Vibrio cholerae]TXY78095.1 hypothetical protein FXE80_01685 [Vibrio cholerae]GIB17263.1 hypothetical protein VCSRO90_2940 [Vibrio cholerae]